MRGSALRRSFVVLATCACGAPAPLELGRKTAPIVHGEDDRVEAFAVTDPALRRLAEETAVAILLEESLSVQPAAVTITAPTLSEAANLCEGERFAEQPAAAVCSGLLVEPNLVLTAGHCVRMAACESMRLVVGFYYSEEGRFHRVTPGDIYRCSEVVASERSVPDAAERLDYAWVRLDRTVDDLAERAITVRGSEAPLAPGEALTMFGFPNGVPLKVDLGAEVGDPRPDVLDYFVSTTDSFSGNSGSPIFDVERRLVGIQNRGAVDFTPNETGCNTTVRAGGDPQSSAEQATYAFRALDGLCSAADFALTCGGVEDAYDGPVQGSGCNLAAVARRSGRARETIILLLAGAAMLLSRRIRLRAVYRSARRDRHRFASAHNDPSDDEYHLPGRYERFPRPTVSAQRATGGA